MTHTPLEQIETWIFDFDDTLYPAGSALSLQIEARICSFIAKVLVMPEKDAYLLQKALFHKYGTTLYGLMIEYGVRADEFFSYICDIDLDSVIPDIVLSEALSNLQGKKYIFTNNTRAYVEDVGSSLGIIHHFDGIFDTRDGDYVPKPHRATFIAFLRRFSVSPEYSAMFDDLPCNLRMAQQVGMTCILVKGHNAAPPQMNPILQPNQTTQYSGLCNDDIHHTTYDLAAFLRNISSPSRTALYDSGI